MIEAPVPRSSIDGAVATTVFHTPNRFTSTMSRNSCSSSGLVLPAAHAGVRDDDVDAAELSDRGRH